MIEEVKKTDEFGEKETLLLKMHIEIFCMFRELRFLTKFSYAKSFVILDI